MTLAKFLREQKRDIMVSRRISPAIKQLGLAQSLVVFPSDVKQNPLILLKARWCKTEILRCWLWMRQVAVDTEMMDEIKQVAIQSKPFSCWCDDWSRCGKYSKALSNIASWGYLTKVDGDARGGTALSIRQILGKPIRWWKRSASRSIWSCCFPRILGMGDVLLIGLERSLIVKRKKWRRNSKAMISFREQRWNRKMGGMIYAWEITSAKNAWNG